MSGKPRGTNGSRMNKVPRVRVIVDPRDGSKDVTIEEGVARRLRDMGTLQWDVTNGAYCVPDGRRLDLRAVGARPMR